MNSEQNEAKLPANDSDGTTISTNKSLTLAAKKLAGSVHCLNCGTGLQGPFCHYCGQPDRNFLRFFPVLLRDLMEDLLDLDSRFMRTLKPLLFKPGKLTRDYMQGRRFRYAPPMRLYIFSSIIFFLLAAFISSDSISIDQNSVDAGLIHISTDSEEERQQVEDTLESLPDSIRTQISVDDSETKEGSPDNDDEFDLNSIQFNGEPWDRETNPIDIHWLPDWINDRINNEIEESPQKAEQINDNPNLIIDKVFEILPATMFVLLPFVALIFKFWYLFAKRFYIEHLIFSLHNHSFLFVSMIFMMLASLAGELLHSMNYQQAATGFEWLSIAVGIWIPLYLLISLKVVFGQGWLLTLGKFSAIGISYLTLLTIVTSGVAIASFVLL